MDYQTRILGASITKFIGLLTIVLCLIDNTLASLDGYVPGQDYPAYTEVPKGLSFSCNDKIPGYYADPETMCQVWHWCVPGLGGNTMYSFLCGPGTVFNQRTRVCDWFFKVDCPNASSFYGVNEDLYKDETGNYIAGKKGNSYNSQYDRRRLSARQKRTEYIRTKKHTEKQRRKTGKKSKKIKPSSTTEVPLTVLGVDDHLKVKAVDW